jgi:hypothetical protein
MDPGEIIGHEQAQSLSSLEPGTNVVAAALAGGVTACEPSGVFFQLDLAAELDLSAIDAVYEARDPRGVKAYEPRM